MRRYDHFYCDGAWHAAGGPAAPDILNPATEAPAAALQACSPADVDLAVESAYRAFQAWSRSGLDERRAVMQALHGAIERRAGAFADMLADEVGVPRTVSMQMQVPMPLRNLALAIAGLDDIAWEQVVGNSRVLREPAGVVAGITPWNFPLHQIVAKAAAALGAGCTLVLKPSETAPGVARLFMDAVDEAGLPPGVINMVWGGPAVGERLVAHPRVDLVSFTGSEGVARKIMLAAAPGLKRVALELGGKSAALVLDGADLDAALPAVLRSCMVNSGQTCVAQSRLLVPAALRDQAVARLGELARDWVPGLPDDPATRLGPVATAAQFERVNGHIAAALSEGARLVCGGAGRAAGFDRGYFIAPTVFANVPPAARLAVEEVFGPVLAVISYDAPEDGIALANATPYGLSGAVWAETPEQAEYAARHMRTGQVSLNGGAPNLAAPFGGFGMSGFGRENGRFGIEDYLSYKAFQCPAS